MDVPIRLLTNGKRPQYMTDGAAGLDCYASEPAIVPARSRTQVQLGFVIAIPPGYEGQIRPRSGIAMRDGVFAVLGTIDSDYRGPVTVLLHNSSGWPLGIEIGHRVCQLVICPVTHVDLVEVSGVSETVRGGRGYGSTGK